MTIPSDKKLRYVDGYKIRQHWDPDFTVIHYQSPDLASFDSKWYVPKNEIWYDQAFKGEEDFFLKVLFSGLDEREEIKKAFCQTGECPNFILATEEKNGLQIQTVDGQIIRQYFDPEFVFGGHDLVYDYVPAKTIWLDSRQDSRDLPFTLLHEEYERDLMSQGKSYDVAHDFATVREKEERRKFGAGYVGEKGFLENFKLTDFYYD